MENQNGSLLHVTFDGLNIVKEHFLEILWALNVDGTLNVASFVFMAVSGVNDYIGVTLVLHKLLQSLAIDRVHVWSMSQI